MRSSQRASLAAGALLLAALVAATFGRAVGHGFVWDDHVFVTDREAYRNGDLGTIFLTLSANGLEYLPVRDLTYVLDFALWGRNPAGFHLANLVYHALTAIVVLLFATRLAAALPGLPGACRAADAGLVGFLTAALFAVHPVNAEAVNFVTCRNTLVSGLFFFLACHAYLNHLTGTASSRTGWYVGSLACFVLALFSKATAIVLPVALLLMHFLPSAPRRRRDWVGLLPFAALSGAGFLVFRAVALRTHVIPADAAAPDLSAIGSKAAMAVQIPVFYLSKLLVPRAFSPDYSAAQFALQFADRRVLWCALIVVVAAGCAFAARKRLPVLTFAVGWFLLALLPVLHIFPTYPVVADRYAYIPSFAVFLLTAAAGARLAARRALAGAAIAGALVLGLALLSFRQSATWRSTATLWEHAVEVSPGSTKALSNLGRYYFIEKGEYDRGLALFKRAQDVDPGNPNYDLFLGGLAIMRGDPRGAIAPLSRALARDPQRMETLVNLGVAYEALGERGKAAEFYRRAANSTQADPAGNVRQQARERLRRLGG